MTDRFICPACKGVGARKVAVPVGRYTTDPDSDFVRLEWATCSLCGGDGESPAAKRAPALTVNERDSGPGKRT
jgi:hypothetical protein